MLHESAGPLLTSWTFTSGAENVSGVASSPHRPQELKQAYDMLLWYQWCRGHSGYWQDACHQHRIQ